MHRRSGATEPTTTLEGKGKALASPRHSIATVAVLDDKAVTKGKRGTDGVVDRPSGLGIGFSEHIFHSPAPAPLLIVRRNRVGVEGHLRFPMTDIPPHLHDFLFAVPSEGNVLEIRVI